MARGFIGQRLGTGVDRGVPTPTTVPKAGGVFSMNDNYYLSKLGTLIGGINATGGTKDTSSRPGWTLHKFTGSGSLVVNSGSQTDVEYLSLIHISEPTRPY